jgi:hypothetical protein
MNKKFIEEFFIHWEYDTGYVFSCYIPYYTELRIEDYLILFSDTSTDLVWDPPKIYNCKAQPGFTSFTYIVDDNKAFCISSGKKQFLESIETETSKKKFSEYVHSKFNPKNKYYISIMGTL